MCVRRSVFVKKMRSSEESVGELGGTAQAALPFPDGSAGWRREFLETSIQLLNRVFAEADCAKKPRVQKDEYFA